MGYEAKLTALKRKTGQREGGKGQWGEGFSETTIKDT